MSKVADFLYRLSILPLGGKCWHWRYYGPGYRVKKGAEGVVVSCAGRTVPAGNLPRVDNGSLRIICSGPSAGDLDRQSLQGDSATLALNGSHAIVGGESHRFSYYLVADVGFVTRQWESFVAGVKKSRTLLVDHRVLRELLERDASLLDGRRLVLFNLAKRPYRRPCSEPRHDPAQGLYYNGREEFSTNAEHGFVTGKTVAYLALQLAVAMGYRRIAYYGLDLGGTRRFYTETNPEQSMLDKDYREFIEPCFAWGAEICRSLGVEVVNASTVSRLPDTIFPRMDHGGAERFLA